MPKDDWTNDDYKMSKNWTVERKWRRVQELLVGAESVEILDMGAHYVCRVWTKPAKSS